MQELIGIMRNKYPGITSHSWYRQNAFRLAGQVTAISRLRFRRPDLYEQQMTALANWAVREVEAMDERGGAPRQKSYRARFGTGRNG